MEVCESLRGSLVEQYNTFKVRVSNEYFITAPRFTSH